jgi:hypothetical protein
MMMRYLALVASVGLAPLACASSAPRHPEPAAVTATPAPLPPRPQVSTHGVTRYASLVSYCWSEARRGVCADGAPGRPAQNLVWSAGAALRVDLRLPAHDVHFDTVRIRKLGTPSRDVIHLGARRLDPTGRRWLVRLPLPARPATDLLIVARFAEGDLLADLGLRQH